MIFNKDNKGNEELRTLTGAYYKSNDFDKISMKVQLASEDLCALISNEVFAKAEVHYQSTNYQLDAPTATTAFLDSLVKHIQLPIAYMATLWHYQGNDISHEDTGRKVKIDADNEKMPWEWMYNRDDAAALRMYQKAYDRLINFLNANASSIEEWENSDARKKAMALFIYNWEQFNDLFAIDASPSFFLRLAPVMAEIERKFIKPILGADKFNELKTLIQGGEDLSEANQELYETVCDPIPLLTMAKAAKRFSLTVMPEGVVQFFTSSDQVENASQAVVLEHIKYVAKDLHRDGLEVLNELKKYWSALNTDESEQSIEDLLPGMDRTDKFISL
jgi:hypothetical protein